jgi:L,D-transpeptidase ErfK/SrfK
VRVVNQPFVFGWHEGQLYMQPYDVLEDDTRDWRKAPRKLFSKSLATTLQQQLKMQHEKINWDEVSGLTHAPRGIPVPVSVAGAGLDRVLAAAPRVQNVLPPGSTWDGKSDLPMDEGSFRQILSEIQPGTPTPGTPVAAPEPGSPANKSPAAVPAPKNGG